MARIESQIRSVTDQELAIIAAGLEVSVSDLFTLQIAQAFVTKVSQPKSGK